MYQAPCCATMSTRHVTTTIGTPSVPRHRINNEIAKYARLRVRTPTLSQYRLPAYFRCKEQNKTNSTGKTWGVPCACEPHRVRHESKFQRVSLHCVNLPRSLYRQYTTQCTARPPHWQTGENLKNGFDIFEIMSLFQFSNFSLAIFI